LDVIVAINMPANLRKGSGDPGIYSAIVDRIGSCSPKQLTAHSRDELHDRAWCGLEAPRGYLILSMNEIAAELSDEIAVGDGLTWDDERLDLMAWRPAAQP
jgi:hypothetical protein